MSFGLLKHSKEARKGKHEVTIARHTKHVIVGYDLGAVLKLVELRKAFPDEAVKIITNRPLSRQILLENFQYGVSTLRTTEAVEGIYRKHFNARILSESKDPVFYKDGKFHEFGSRAKPMNILVCLQIFVTSLLEPCLLPSGGNLEFKSLFKNQMELESSPILIHDPLVERVFKNSFQMLRFEC